MFLIELSWILEMKAAVCSRSRAWSFITDDVHLRRIHVVAALRGDDADGKLDHLAGLLLEGHSLQDLLHFGLHLGVRFDGGRNGGGFAATGDGSRGGKGEGSGLQGVFYVMHNAWDSVIFQSSKIVIICFSSKKGVHLYFDVFRPSSARL